MKVLDYELPGDSPKTILFNAHNCHPYQANDDLSGCVVGMDVMRRLAALPKRRYSYRLVIAPELIGTVFWLDSLGEAARDLSYAVMLKAVGAGGALRLQESFTGESTIDRAAHHVFALRWGAYESGPFRTIYGNDETVFEAPGYEIPSVSLTRWPFAGYHTDRDTPDRLSERILQETADVATEICLALERNVRLERRFQGLVSLSHPRYGLYKPAPAPGVERGAYTDTMAKWNLLMNCLPRYLDGQTGLLDVARRFGLPLDEVHEYAMQWVDKGLADVVDWVASEQDRRRPMP
jgi:aminopeptidase-like protein